MTLPVGLIRDPLQRVVKHPDLEVQARIALIFETFLRVRSATQVVRSFNADRLFIPRKDDLGDIVWRRKGTTVYFPIATSVVVSLVLTLILNLLFRRK